MTRPILLSFISLGFVLTTPLVAGWTQQTHTSSAKKKKRQPKATPEHVRAHNKEFIKHIEHTPMPDAPQIPWKYIVVHHTASEWSSRARIDAYHREKFDDPDGIEYHFLIGNGKKRPEGWIEHGRWPLQKRSIHLFRPERAPDAITVSLVGNFHTRQMGEGQYEALLRLVAHLAGQHEIPLSRITTHTGVDGRLTVCPGEHFPKKRLLADLEALGVR